MCLLVVRANKALLLLLVEIKFARKSRQVFHRVATQRKSMRKFNLPLLATTCDSVWPRLNRLEHRAEPSKHGTGRVNSLFNHVNKAWAPAWLISGADLARPVLWCAKKKIKENCLHSKMWFGWKQNVCELYWPFSQGQHKPRSYS